MRFENQTFTDDVTLDYNTFINCTIKDCTILYHGGEYSLQNTTFVNVKFALAGPANNTLAFLRVVRASGEHLLHELLDQDPKPGPGQKVTIN